MVESFLLFLNDKQKEMTFENTIHNSLLRHGIHDGLLCLLCSFVLFVSVVSCNSSNSQVAKELSRVEQILSVAPDSAFYALRRINPSALIEARDAAQYSLLYSIALEKNNILVRTDTIIAPAVDYYMKKGTPEQKLMVRYYQARVYENADMDEEAMSALVDGEKYYRQSKDYDLRAKFILKKAALYGRIYDFRNALENATIARDEYSKANDVEGYVTAVLAMSSYYQYLSDYATSRRLLSEVKDRWSKINDNKKEEYFRQMINYYLL